MRRLGVSVYGAVCVVLAELLHTELWTADGPLYRATRGSKVVRWLADYPLPSQADAVGWAFMPVLQLANEDARIVALALAYHLARPGSETDPETLQHHDLGLGRVMDALAPQIEQARVELDVTAYQLHRLDEALLGATNELKQYEMAQRRSSVPHFEETLGRLFPELARDVTVAEEAASALDLVERVVMLRRRLTAVVQAAETALAAEREAAAAAARARPRWWQFWKRRPPA